MRILVFIDVFYQTGTVGFFVFFSLHALFTWRFLTHARNMDAKLRNISAALFIGYVTTMGLFCMQPSYVAAVMTTCLTVGFMLKILRLSRGKDLVLEAAPPRITCPYPKGLKPPIGALSRNGPVKRSGRG